MDGSDVAGIVCWLIGSRLFNRRSGATIEEMVAQSTSPNAVHSSKSVSAAVVLRVFTGPPGSWRQWARTFWYGTPLGHRRPFRHWLLKRLGLLRNLASVCFTLRLENLRLGSFMRQFGLPRVPDAPSLSRATWFWLIPGF